MAGKGGGGGGRGGEVVGREWRGRRVKKGGGR